MTSAGLRRPRATAIIVSWLHSLEGHSDRLEPLWRASRLASDRRRCIALVIVVALLAVARGGLGVVDVLLGDDAGHAGMLVELPFALWLAPSMLALLFVVLLRRASTPAVLDRVMTAAVALLVLGLVLERGVGTPVHVVSALTVVGLIWTLLPQPLTIRLPLALLLSVPVSVQLLIASGNDPHRATVDLLVLATVTLFAGWLSVREHAARRAQFRFLDVSGRLRDRAERIRGLLPVCAWCKRLRDEAGYWRAVHEFIDSDDLGAVASAECDACRTRAQSHDQTAPGGGHCEGRPSARKRPAAVTPAAADPALRQARVQVAPLFIAVMFLSLGLMAQSLVESGTDALESAAFRLRAVNVLVSIAVLAFVLTTVRRPWFDAVLVGWALWISSLLLYIQISGDMGFAPSVVALAMLAMAFGLPVPAPLRVVPAMLLLAGGLWLVLLPPDGAFAPAAPHLAADLMIGFCVALWFSVERERHQQALQLAEQEVAAQRRITNRLGALLPVCRVCKSVRDGDGYWRDVGSHLQLAAADRWATHGICESCLGIELELSDATPQAPGHFPERS